MPLYIKDDETAELVAKLAAQRGTTKQEAVRQAVVTALGYQDETVPMRERIARWRAANPLPPATGLKADKAFFDELSGETD